MLKPASTLAFVRTCAVEVMHPHRTISFGTDPHNNPADRPEPVTRHLFLLWYEQSGPQEDAIGGLEPQKSRLPAGQLLCAAPDVLDDA